MALTLLTVFAATAGYCLLINVPWRLFLPAAAGGVLSWAVYLLLRARIGSLFYLLSDSGVECCTVSGERQWSQTLAAKPQALLADAKELLLFSGNTAQVLEPPQE